MEFPTNISKYLKVNEDGFVICTGKTLSKFIQPNFVNEGTKMIHEIINELGANSAKAQGLKQIITSAIKFSGSDHRLYLKVEGNKAIGFLRTGQKKLFYHDNLGKMREINPTCVLDIYVHQSYQRSGVGKEVFETFLQYENKRPQKLAYDRPSPKLFGFLKKHYGLSKFIPQNNNFVIFDQYFMSIPQSTTKTEDKKMSTGNRFNKYENTTTKPANNIPQHTPLVQSKQLNRTVGSGMKNEIPRKQEKIEDSLSLLEKEINRLHLKTPPVMTSGKDTTALKQGGYQGIQNGMVGSKVEQGKLNAYMNYAPWATTSDPIFRTTSNSYGAYYKGK